MSIVHLVVKFDLWFLDSLDTFGHMDLSTLQKCTATVCMLANGMVTHACDGYRKLDEFITEQCMMRFYFDIRNYCKSTYLRQWTRED